MIDFRKTTSRLTGTVPVRRAVRALTARAEPPSPAPAEDLDRARNGQETRIDQDVADILCCPTI